MSQKYLIKFFFLIILLANNKVKSQDFKTLSPKVLEEETELLDIMNTLTNVSKDELANEMFKDLTDTMPIKDRGIEVTQIGDSKEETKEYSTNTFLFDDKDFDSVKSEIGKSSKLLKFFTFLLTIIVIVGVAIFIKIFVLK